MLFHLTPDTECELTTFVGRTQKAGNEDVPAVTFRLKLASVSNSLLDLFSPTIRLTAYAPVEGQEQLPGLEAVTPVLRSTDLKHWAPETRLEGWTVVIARGITDDSALQMGSCKLDDFRFDLYQGGHIDVDFRVSTADVAEDGAGMLWGRQKRKVFATITAPELPDDKPVIDGTVAAFQADHPEADTRSAGDLFTEQHGDGQHAGDFGRPDSGEADSEGGDTDIGLGAGEADLAAEAQRGGEAWPFPQDGAAEGQDQAAELEAGMAQAMAAAGMKPKAERRPRRAAGGAVE